VRGLLVTWNRELRSLFFTPVGWIILALFYLLWGAEIRSYLLSFANEGSVDGFLSAYVGSTSNYIAFVLVPPLLTMRLFAEEQRSGSLEVLMTAPVREWEVVLGKWLGACTFFALLWAPTIPLLGVLSLDGFMGVEFDLVLVVVGYLGLFLFGSMLLAVGCLFSSLTDNVLLAAVMGILFNFALFTLPMLTRDTLRPLAQEHFWVLALYEKVDIMGVLGNWFARGVVDTSHIVFFVTGTAVFLLMTALVLGARRWR